MNPVIKDGMISTICSMISSTIVYPVNSIKVGFQTQKDKTPSQVFKSLYKTKGLYNGLRYNLTTYPVFWGVFFPIKNYFNFPKTNNTFMDKFISVSISGSIASFVANPLFVQQVRAVTGNHSSFSNMISKEGILSPWKGYPSTVFNNLKLCIQFPLYDCCQEKLNNSLLSSAIAKITANTIFYPLDLVRTRQRNSKNNLPLHRAFIELHKSYGFKGFYRGMLLYNGMSVPNFCLMMFFIENIKPYLG